MMFEVADLAVASPATVSRCGMVYMGTNVVGIWPLIECWLLTVPSILTDYTSQLQELFKTFLLVRMISQTYTHITRIHAYQYIQNGLTICCHCIHVRNDRQFFLPLLSNFQTTKATLFSPNSLKRVVWNVIFLSNTDFICRYIAHYLLGNKDQSERRSV